MSNIYICFLLLLINIYYYLFAHRKPTCVIGVLHRYLVHFRVDLCGTAGSLDGLSIRDETGLTEKISANYSDARVNVLKSVAGIFIINNYRLNFEVVEVPGAGIGTSKTLVIHKQKVVCQPIGQPLDARVWSG